MEIIVDEVKRSLELFRALIENSHDAICMINEQWEIIYRSPMAEKLTDFTLDELKGKKIFDFIHPDDADETIKFYNDLLNEPGVPKHKSHRVLHKDGHYIWTEGTMTNLLDHVNVKAIISNFHDITERKKAEEELIKSELRYHSVINQASDAIMITNQSGDFVDVNISMCNMFGYTREELLASNVSILIDPKQLKNDPLRYDVLKTGQPLLRERKMIHKDGTIIDVEANVKMLPDGRMLAIARDITERKNYQQALLASSAQMKLIFDSLDISFWAFDTIHPKMLFVSPGNKKVFGFEDHEFLSNPDLWYKIILPEDKHIVDKVYAEMNERRSASLQYRIIHADGTMHWIEARMTPAFNSAGEFIRLDGIALDITEHKKAEEVMKTSEKKYKLLFYKNPLPMWVMSLPDMKIVDVNETAIEHYGYSREEFLSMTAKEIRPHEELPSFLNYIDKRFEETNYAGIWRHLKKDGTIIKVEIIAHSMEHEGMPARLIVSTDVTEKMIAEEKLRESHEQLRQLSSHLQSVREEERTAISREIHDELGQQLTALKMDASWLNKKISPADELAHNKIVYMIALIDDTMKTVRRISTELRPGILDDLGLVDALDWQSHEFEQRTGIQCSFKSVSDDLQFEKNISTGIFRIFQEALTNVTRHSQATEITASFETDNDEVVLTIQDNGKGFDDAETKNKKTLGLIGMKERAAMLHGKLLIESVKGKGTSIHLRIPKKLAVT